MSICGFLRWPLKVLLSYPLPLRLQGKQLTVSESPNPNKLWEGNFKQNSHKKVALEVISECFLGKTHRALVGEL